ncbi:hypothetical protein V8J08_000928 [Citrobacter amalonaticus]|uniref:hypothetical protein n=1 Tax=Citrobacter sp. CFNIH10 TaxID=1920110 RepID=UPI000CEB8CFE|nr:hypothetical protein [Citrobacter sp. CFNIH10]AUZ67095.1 hypothetical protein C2U53_26500 [Citrobacter sp. CFNIH10]MBU5644629.1 hypothetical protein [Pluralibacter sp. S54_ASV_43]
MSRNTVEAKRAILQAQPGKKYHYHNDSGDLIEAYYAAYMAQHHPEIRFDEHEGYALAQSAAIKAAKHG